MVSVNCINLMLYLTDVVLLATGVVLLPIGAAPKLPSRLKQPCPLFFFTSQADRKNWKDIYNLAKDILYFLEDIYNLVKDFLYFMEDIYNLAKDFLYFMEDIYNLVKDFLYFMEDSYNLVKDFLYFMEDSCIFAKVDTDETVLLGITSGSHLKWGSDLSSGLFRSTKKRSASWRTG